MGDVLGYARVSTGDQDVAGQALRLRGAGAIKVFTDVRSGRSMDRPGLAALLDYARRSSWYTVERPRPTCRAAAVGDSPAATSFSAASALSRSSG